MKPTIEISITKGYEEGYKAPLVGGTEWVAALRSGKYKQGRKQLFSPMNDSYCCLGVLCDVQGRRNDLVTRGLICEPTPCLPVDNPIQKVIGSLGEIPVWFNVVGVELKENGIIRKRPFVSLATLNDAGYSFSLIAAVIETCWDCQPLPQPEQTNEE